MSDYVAIAKLADPKEQSQSSIVTSGGSRDTAALELFEAKHAKGGSTKGKSLGFIGFQFNPKEITITKAAHWERKPVAKAPGGGPPEFKGADPCKLTVEMFFDATLKSDQSVVDAVEKLLSCCIPTKESGEKKPMPPLVEFQWGGTKSFPAFVTQVNAKYTRFASNGVPIRAVCTVNLEEMPPNDKRKQPKQNPTSGVFAVERVHTMISGDNLALVAYDEYGDPALWRALAAYNGFDDPMRIANGTRILLPPAEELLA
jgi:Contractile injection system tube protein